MILNPIPKILIFAAFNIERQQITCHQMEEYEGLYWGPLSWIEDVYFDGPVRNTYGSQV